MRKRRLTACAVMAAGAILMAGCGGDEGGSAASGDSGGGGDKKVKVGFVPKSLESAFWNATKDGAAAAAEADPNIELMVDAAAS